MRPCDDDTWRMTVFRYTCRVVPLYWASSGSKPLASSCAGSKQKLLTQLQRKHKCSTGNKRADKRQYQTPVSPTALRIFTGQKKTDKMAVRIRTVGRGEGEEGRGGRKANKGNKDASTD